MASELSGKRRHKRQEKFLRRFPESVIIGDTCSYWAHVLGKRGSVYLTWKDVTKAIRSGELPERSSDALRC